MFKLEKALSGRQTLRQQASRTFALIAPRLDLPRLSSKPLEGGGGARSSLPAGFGKLPRRAPRPFVPPSEVNANRNPRLSMEPAIVVPPDVKLIAVNAPELGDPLSKFPFRSDGPGQNGGIGSGRDGGIGDGRGPRFDSRNPQGFSASIHQGGVKAPVLIYKIDPEYSEDARKAKHQGTVVLSAEIDVTGRVRNVRVISGLGLGLDEKAVEAVYRWKFRPAYRDGRPVVAPATIEVNFRLL